MRDLIDREWNAVLGLWIDAQVNLGKVWRWGTFCDGNPLFRKQHTLEHTYSLLIVGMISIIKLRDFVKLDETLLLQAFAVHDWGEGELNRDVLFHLKSAKTDCEEYGAFVGAFDKISPDIVKGLKEPFLLQFARENPACFPREARRIMTRLWKKKRNEVIVFETIERFDYVLYALEHSKTGNGLLRQVLKKHAPKLDQCVEELPAFGKVVWTPERRKVCETYLSDSRDFS